MSDQKVPATTADKPQEVLRKHLAAKFTDFLALMGGDQKRVERFFAVIIAATLKEPRLLTADRLSLFEAAFKAANDDLMPDGREGAFVIYNTNSARKGEPANWIAKVQWMPMVGGLFKRLYATGAVKSAKAEIVHENDDFDVWMDDQGEHVHFRQARGDRGEPSELMAAVWMKDGTVFAERMSLADANAVRMASKNADKAPWVGPFSGEMQKKTVFRRLSKRLPMAREMLELFKTFDSFSTIEGSAVEVTTRKGSLSDQLDRLATSGAQPRIANTTTAPMEIVDGDTGEIIEQDTDGGKRNDPPAQAAKAPDNAGSSPSSGATQITEAQAFKAGEQAREAGTPRKAMPVEFKRDEALMRAWLDGYDGPDEREPGQEG